jgi:tetratricopeptide (TPR) repeat protein
VFVSPAAFAKFKESGKWPEGTIFALEIRYSTSQGSINKGGFYQTDVAALEVAVKDSKRFPQGWGYFDFSGGISPQRKSAALLGANAGCQACHSANGAVEQTFTQFYPTALSIAERRGTVRSNYQSPAPSPVRLFHTVKAASGDPAAELDRAKALDPDSAALREGDLNRMGYSLLQSGDPERAIAILKWTSQQYPNSANAQDSLAEALEAGKRTSEALTATTRALALLDQDQAMPAARKDRLRKALQERRDRLSAK